MIPVLEKLMDSCVAKMLDKDKKDDKDETKSPLKIYLSTNDLYFKYKNLSLITSI